MMINPPQTHLEVLLQTSEQLSIHLATLCEPQPLPFGLLQSVLKDPTVLVGSLQLSAHVLQLAGVFLIKGVPHLIHFCPHLLDFNLAKHGEKYDNAYQNNLIQPGPPKENCSGPFQNIFIEIKPAALRAVVIIQPVTKFNRCNHCAR